MNRFMKVGVFGFLVIAAGCETIFTDNFNSDTVGSPPALSPPGNPAGDSIYLPTVGSAYPSPATVVTATGFTSNALRYSNINIPAIWRYLGFLSTTVDPAATHYIASWIGRLNLSNSSSALDVWFGDSHFSAIASLRFDNGHVYLEISSSPPVYEDLGTYVNDSNHTVFFNVDKNAETYTISIFQTGGEDINTGTRPVLNPDALDTQNPTVYFWFSEDNVSSSGNYTVDSVNISQRLPSAAAITAGDISKFERGLSKEDREKLAPVLK